MNSNQLPDLLDHWYPKRDSQAWVLGTVYQTAGPCYRKPGAMMLFNDTGQQFGLLSGGCLEGDIQQHAAQVMHSGQAKTLCYDGSDEDDLAFQLGIGCGGVVSILLQAVTPANNYLALDQLREQLQRGACAHFEQQIPAQPSGPARAQWQPVLRQALLSKAQRQHRNGQQWLVTPVKPAPQLLVVGAGVDAQPLVSMAAQLGWTITLCDHRPANGRLAYFPEAKRVIRCLPEQLPDDIGLPAWDAAIVMSHNLKLDAQAIKALQQAPALQYLALLGPHARKLRVLAMAGLAETSLALPIAGPAGIDLGGELPESIALSIVAQCHRVLNRGSGQPLSGILPSAEGAEQRREAAL